jgi:hypothetical protein
MFRQERRVDPAERNGRRRKETLVVTDCGMNRAPCIREKTRYIDPIWNASEFLLTPDEFNLVSAR